MSIELVNYSHGLRIFNLILPYFREWPTKSKPYLRHQKRGSNEAEGARTLNLRIDSPQQQDNNSLDNKDLQQAEPGAYKPVYKQNTKAVDDNFTALPPDLAEIVTVWPNLPEHIQSTIKALIEVVSLKPKVNNVIEDSSL